MHEYLRIFLACVPTQLVKAFGIKRLNMYSLVRTVRPPAERAAPGWWALLHMCLMCAVLCVCLVCTALEGHPTTVHLQYRTRVDTS